MSGDVSAEKLIRLAVRGSNNFGKVVTQVGVLGIFGGGFLYFSAGAVISIPPSHCTGFACVWIADSIAPAHRPIDGFASLLSCTANCRSAVVPAVLTGFKIAVLVRLTGVAEGAAAWGEVETGDNALVFGLIEAAAVGLAAAS